MTETVRADVLVIGGGGAAARAALEAGAAEANVVMAVKGSFGAIGTRGSGATASAVSPFGVFATPGWTGATSEVERPLAFKLFTPREQALSNIIQVGLGMADPKLAEILVDEAVETRLALLNWGVTFGEWGIRSHGVSIMEALRRHIRTANIAIRERVMITDLLIQNGECLGAIGIDETNGNTIIFEAGATVIATGGDANLFMLSLNPPDNTGDGYAMGYLAGAELMNLEFKQIFLGTVYPTKNMLIRMLHPQVKLTNMSGEEFLQDHLPNGVTAEDCLAQRQLHNPFSTRDPLSKYVDIAIINEIKAGRGTQHHGIYLDCTDPRIPPLTIPRKEFFQYRGIDFSEGPVEIGICHHSALGGFRINEHAQTSVPNLYAVGEVAAGPHGADRMAGHMLLASQVFGARAGRHAANNAIGRELTYIDSKVLRLKEERIKSLSKKRGNKNPLELTRMLQRSAYFDLMVVKTKESLTRFLNEVKHIGEEVASHLNVTSPEELVEAFELQNLLMLAELEAVVCLKRTESRGPHYREDFPDQDDDNWLKSITLKKEDDGPQLETVSLDPKWKNAGDEKVKQWG